MLTNSGPSNFAAAWTLEILAYCAVDIFGLVSGYIGYRDKFRFPRVSRWLLLWFRTVLVGVVILAFCRLAGFECANGISMKHVIFPLAYGSYWYFSAYTGVFFAAPFINCAVAALDDSQARKSAILGFILMTGICTIDASVDPLKMAGGYSFIWLACLYFLGACIRKAHLGQQVRTRTLLCIYAGCGLITILFKTIFYSCGLAFHQTPLEDLLVSYCSPTVLAMGITVLLVCLKLDRPLDAAWAGRCRRLGSATYSMYISNGNPAIWVWRKDRYSFLATLAPAGLIGGALLWTVIEFAVLLVFSLAADWVVEKIQAHRFFDWLVSRLKERTLGRLSF